MSSKDFKIFLGVKNLSNVTSDIEISYDDTDIDDNNKRELKINRKKLYLTWRSFFKRVSL